MVELAVWYILNKNECASQFNNTRMRKKITEGNEIA